MAVILEVADEEGRPLSGVTMRYRVEDGEWQDLPEWVNRRAVIFGGPGAYEVRVQKPGFVTQETAVSVSPSATDSCRPVTTNVAVSLPPLVCSVEADPITLQVVAPAQIDNIEVFATLPGGRRQTLTCDQPNSAGCQTFTLPVADTGAYTLAVRGLPQDGQMVVVDGVISYTYQPFEIQLFHGGRQQVVRGEGAGSVTISMPVTLDEVNCLLADFRDLTAQLDPDLDNVTGPYPPVRTWQQRRLVMTDLGAEVCQQQPVITPVTYQVVVPAGTRLADVSLVYWGGRQMGWQTAECEMQNGRLLCTAQFPNPFLREPYVYKAVVNGQEFIGTQLPFDNMCILFP